MTKTDLKLILYKKYDFIDNEFFDQYLTLILNYDSTSLGYREKHHIIPVMLYKTDTIKTRTEALKIAEADKDNFCVNLLFKDHCLAHYLLYNCTKDKIKSGNAAVIKFLNDMYIRLTKIDKKMQFNYTDFELLQQYYNQIVNDPENQLWALDELQFLVANYAEKGQRFCAEYLGRSLSAVSSKAYSIGLKMDKWWSKEDKRFLKDNFKKYTVEELSKLLNRSVKAIKSKASILDLTPQVLYTEGEKQFLKDYYPKYGLDYCAEKLGKITEKDKINLKCYISHILHLKREFPQGNPILCIELNKAFASIKQASEILKISDGNICSVLKGRLESTNGYHFKRISKEEYYNEKK